MMQNYSAGSSWLTQPENCVSANTGAKPGTKTDAEMKKIKTLVCWRQK